MTKKIILRNIKTFMVFIINCPDCNSTMTAKQAKKYKANIYQDYQCTCGKEVTVKYVWSTGEKDYE